MLKTSKPNKNKEPTKNKHNSTVFRFCDCEEGTCNCNTKSGTAEVITHSSHHCVQCFNSLGIDSRMTIYKVLKDEGKKTVNEIVTVVGLTQPTTSYHLKEMKTVGILDSIRKGKKVYYFVSDSCPVYKTGCVLKDVIFPENS